MDRANRWTSGVVSTALVLARYMAAGNQTPVGWWERSSPKANSVRAQGSSAAPIVVRVASTAFERAAPRAPRAPLVGARGGICQALTFTGTAITVLSAGFASRAPMIVATASKDTLPSVASCASNV